MALDAAMSLGDTLARMLAYVRLPYVAEEEREAHALRYQLVTEATSFFVVHERADKASSMPELQKIAQMHAAGVHGVGTAGVQRVAFESLSMPLVASSMPGPVSAADFDMELPAFLRRDRVAEVSNVAPRGFQYEAILTVLRLVTTREELADAVRRLAVERHGRGIDRVIAALRRILGDKELAWYVLLEWLAREEHLSLDIVALLGEATGGRGDEAEVRAVLASL